MWRGLSEFGASRSRAWDDIPPAAARASILLTVLLWGAQYPLTHDLAERWDPYSMLLIRFPIGAAILLGWAMARGDHVTRPPKTPPGWGRRLMLGVSMGAFGVLFTLALAIGDPMTNAVLAAVAPITAAMVSWATEGKAPDRSLLLPLALVVPGAALASLELSAGAPARRTFEGAMLLLLGQACWAFYSVRAQQWLAGCSRIEMTGRSLLYATPFLVVAFVAAHAAGLTYAHWQVAPWRDLWQFLVLTLGALVLGVVLWNVSVARLGITVSSMHLNLLPVVAILFSLAFGLVPRPEQIAGTVLVTAGIVIAQRNMILREKGLKR